MGVLQSDRMLQGAVLALFLTAAAVIVIKILDMIADLDESWTPQAVDSAINDVIGMIGILVGFAWEQCFDCATEAISETRPDLISPCMFKMVLAMLCALIIVPAWRLWVLPMAVHNGWKTGFVIDHENDSRWAAVMDHPDFWKAAEKVIINKTLSDESKLALIRVLTTAGQGEHAGTASQEAGIDAPLMTNQRSGMTHQRSGRTADRQPRYRPGDTRRMSAMNTFRMYPCFSSNEACRGVVESEYDPAGLRDSFTKVFADSDSDSPDIDVAQI